MFEPGAFELSRIAAPIRKIVKEEYLKDPIGTTEKYMGKALDEEQERKKSRTQGETRSKEARKRGSGAQGEGNRGRRVSRPPLAVQKNTAEEPPDYPFAARISPFQRTKRQGFDNRFR